ncbi:MAG: hypothetical protein IPK19_17725 [Chloroflexi bacterium]|nr:hypothetical protein [Chloroflexota bacterium]
MKRPRLGILLLVFGLLTIASPTTQAASFTVSNLNDSGPGSLRQALADADAAPGDDTITFSVAGTIPLSSTLTIASAVTIDGPGAASLTISGQNSVRAFWVNSGVTATIQDVTISGGKASIAKGGAIFMQASNASLTVANSAFTGNTADYGGAIFNDNGHLTVTNSTFNLNIANGAGGAIKSDWGVLIVTGSSFTGKGQRPVATEAESQATRPGFACRTAYSAAIARGNSGGAILSSVYNGISMWVVNTTFDGNTSGMGGGLTTSGEGQQIVLGSTFSGNSTSSGCCYNHGGAIFSGNTLWLINSTLTGNSTQFDGGAVANYGTLNVYNSTVHNNNAGRDGDGIYNYNPNALTLNNSILSGSACYGTGMSGSHNVATTGSNCPGATESADLGLGALADNGGLTQTMVLLPGSPAIDAGNNALLPADMTDMDGDANTAEPIPFDQRGAGFPRVGTGTVDAGAVETVLPVFVTVAAASPTLAEGGSTHFVFTRSNMEGDLAVHFTLSGTAANGSDFTLSPLDTITIPDGSSSANVEIDALDDGSAAEGDETVILTLVDDPAYVSDTPASATVTIASSGFTVTNANTSGAGSLALALDNANAIAGTDTITFDPIFFGTARTITPSATLVIASDLTLDGPGANLLTLSGGGSLRVFMVESGVDATIQNVTISDGHSSEFGGGIHNQGMLTIHGSTFTVNEANWGGAVWNSGTLVVTDTIFDTNTSTLGSGIFNEGGTVTVGGSTFSVNTTSAGAGIYSWHGGTVNVDDSTFRGNTAYSAGSIYTWLGSVVTVSNSTFRHNFASADGGSIEVGSGGSVTVTNSLFRNNTANSGNGGALLNIDGTLTVINCTFSDNFAGSQGGGIFSLRGVTTIANATFHDSGIAADSDISPAILRLDNSLLSMSPCYGGLITGANNIASTGNGSGCPATEYANLLFDELADNGGPTQTFALLPGSPAIDAGNNALIPADTADMDGDGNTTEPIPFDQRGAGYPRVMGTSVDAGAVEFNSLPVVTVTVTAASDQITEGGSSTFTVTRSGTTGSLTVYFAVSGTATTGSDFTLSPVSPATFSDGEATATLTLNAMNDGSSAEPDETVVLTLVDDAAYDLGTPSEATITIARNGFLVTNDHANGSGSLAQAVENANLIDGADTITFDPAFFSIARTITPPATLNINSGVTIDGPGADLLTVSGGGLFRVFMVESATDVTIQDVTISGGNSIYGGGIYNDGKLRVTNSTLSGNTAEYGGGIANVGTLAVTNSTLSGNFAEFSGGGIHNNEFLQNSLVSNSTCFHSSGGSWSGANNIASTGSGCPGATEYAYLYVGDLADNGGPTQTIAPAAGSPAIDAGNNTLLSADSTDMDGDGNIAEPIPFDQRGVGYPRVMGTSVDAGAVELNPLTVTTASTTIAEGSSATLTFTRPDTAGTLNVNFVVSGTAADGSDFTFSRSSPVTFLDGEGTTTATIYALNDGSSAEPDETFVLTLVDDAGYPIGMHAAATVTIARNGFSSRTTMPTPPAPWRWRWKTPTSSTARIRSPLIPLSSALRGRSHRREH